MSECITRKATPEELAALERQLGPVNKSGKKKTHHYDNQLMQPHRIVPRHRGDTIRGTTI